MSTARITVPSTTPYPIAVSENKIFFIVQDSKKIMRKLS
jgi:hypothetical protein